MNTPDAPHIAHLSFFRNLTPVKRSECCKAMKLLQFQAGDQVVALGDPSDAFYIILKGSVSVFVPKKRIGDDPPSKLDTFKETVLTVGASFGELGLLLRTTRTATVTCREPCVLAVLSKEDFWIILADLEEAKLAEVLDFLQSIPIFKSWTKTALSKASYHFSNKIYSLNECVFKESSPTSFVYFIVEGEFKLTKAVVAPQKTLDIRSLYGPRTQNESLRRTISFKKGGSVKRLQVVIKTTGEVLGDSEALEGSSYETSCICMSRRGKLLAVSKEVRGT
jgi:CRP-like cAMP-binding protein